MAQDHTNSWRTSADFVDPTAKGGYRRETYATKTNRFEADAALYAAVEAHIEATGCAPDPQMTFPGKTHVSCEHGAFHATGLAPQVVR